MHTRKSVLVVCTLAVLAIACTVSRSETIPIGKRVSWTTADGVILVGRFYPPQQAKGYVWVLLHGLGSVKEEWTGFARELTKRGDGFLMYDARGHGESVTLARGGNLDYHQFQTVGLGSEWDQMINDLGSAVGYLHSKYDLDVKKIAMGGASLGANVALVYASQQSEVPALVLLSPGLQYAGIETSDAFKQYGVRPLFLAASPADVNAYQTVHQWASQRKDAHCMVIDGVGTAHGVNMLQGNFTPRLLAWMKSAENHH